MWPPGAQFISTVVFVAWRSVSAHSSYIKPKIHDVYGEECSNQKLLTYGLKMGVPLRFWVEKTVHEVKTHRLSGKEKVLGINVQ